MANKFIKESEVLNALSEAFEECFGKYHPLERCPHCGRHKVRIKGVESNCFFLDCLYIESIEEEEQGK